MRVGNIRTTERWKELVQRRCKASRFTGVFRAGSKWKAQLQHKNRSIYLGCYATEEEAAAVYQAEKSRIMTDVEGVRLPR